HAAALAVCRRGAGAGSRCRLAVGDRVLAGQHGRADRFGRVRRCLLHPRLGRLRRALAGALHGGAVPHPRLLPLFAALPRPRRGLDRAADAGDALMDLRGPLRVGVGGPVGSGKTALVERLCKTMRDAYDIAVVTNDIYTKEDAEFLTRAGALEPERIVGVETGGGPPHANPEGASINPPATSRNRRQT